MQRFELARIHGQIPPLSLPVMQDYFNNQGYGQEQDPGKAGQLRRKTENQAKAMEGTLQAMSIAIAPIAIPHDSLASPSSVGILGVQAARLDPMGFRQLELTGRRCFAAASEKGLPQPSAITFRMDVYRTADSTNDPYVAQLLADRFPCSDGPQLIIGAEAVHAYYTHIGIEEFASAVGRALVAVGAEQPEELASYPTTPPTLDLRSPLMTI
jgi:hypothetical protein